MFGFIISFLLQVISYAETVEKHKGCMWCWGRQTYFVVLVGVYVAIKYHYFELVVFSSQIILLGPQCSLDY